MILWDLVIHNLSVLMFKVRHDVFEGDNSYFLIIWWKIIAIMIRSILFQKKHHHQANWLQCLIHWLMDNFSNTKHPITHFWRLSWLAIIFLTCCLPEPWSTIFSDDSFLFLFHFFCIFVMVFSLILSQILYCIISCILWLKYFIHVELLLGSETTV